MSYTLRVPVKTLGETPITDLTQAVSFSADGLEVSLSSQPPYLILKTKGFATEDEAKAFLPRVIVGFWSLAVRWNIAFKSEFRPEPITYADDPTQAAINLAKTFGRNNDDGPVDGIIEADATTIYPSEKRIVTLGLGEARVRVSTSGTLAISTLQQGLCATGAAKLVSDARFRTAMELYVEHFYETSPKARFLSLMTVLEVLAPVTTKHQCAQELIRRWKNEISAIQANLAAASDERAALESLNRELDFRKETSIRMRLRAFIRQEFQDATDQDRLQFEKKIVAAYDARGELIHTGTLAPAKLSDAHESVGRILRSLLGKHLGISEQP